MRRFKTQDYPDYANWFEKRGMTPPPEAFLPGLGYLVPGVGAGFLIQTDALVGILDFFATNPDAPAHDRKDTIERIALALVRQAEFCGFKRVQCDSKIGRIQESALAVGFRDVGTFRAFAKEI